jgi:hypothetical protein
VREVQLGAPLVGGGDQPSAEKRNHPRLPTLVVICSGAPDAPPVAGSIATRKRFMLPARSLEK